MLLHILLIIVNMSLLFIACNNESHPTITKEDIQDYYTYEHKHVLQILQENIHFAKIDNTEICLAYYYSQLYPRVLQHFTYVPCDKIPIERLEK